EVAIAGVAQQDVLGENAVELVPDRHVADREVRLRPPWIFPVPRLDSDHASVEVDVDPRAEMDHLLPPEAGEASERAHRGLRRALDHPEQLPPLLGPEERHTRLALPCRLDVLPWVPRDARCEAGRFGDVPLAREHVIPEPGPRRDHEVLTRWRPGPPARRRFRLVEPVLDLVCRDALDRRLGVKPLDQHAADDLVLLQRRRGARGLDRAEESVHARAECERFVERPTEPLDIAVLDYPHNSAEVDGARA